MTISLSFSFSLLSLTTSLALFRHFSSCLSLYHSSFPFHSFFLSILLNPSLNSICLLSVSSQSFSRSLPLSLDQCSHSLSLSLSLSVQALIFNYFFLSTDISLHLPVLTSHCLIPAFLTQLRPNVSFIRAYNVRYKKINLISGEPIKQNIYMYIIYNAQLCRDYNTNLVKNKLSMP